MQGLLAFCENSTVVPCGYGDDGLAGGDGVSRASTITGIVVVTVVWFSVVTWIKDSKRWVAVPIQRTVTKWVVFTAWASYSNANPSASARMAAMRHGFELRMSSFFEQSEPVELGTSSNGDGLTEIGERTCPSTANGIAPRYVSLVTTSNWSEK